MSKPKTLTDMGGTGGTVRPRLPTEDEVATVRAAWHEQAGAVCEPYARISERRKARWRVATQLAFVLAQGAAQSRRGSSTEAERDRRNGQYTHTLDKMCACGRTKGKHMAEPPYDCDDTSDGFPACPKFRLARKRGVNG